jgi:ATP-binding cassette subfamily B protein
MAILSKNLSKLFDYAGGFRYLTITSWILSAVSAVLALLPFIYIWKILQEIFAVAPNYSAAEHLVFYGWMAVLFALISLAVYVSALMCSHIAAFRIASNIRISTLHHLATLPLGFMEDFGSGKLRKIIDESSAATETYLAHQLPDKAGAVATPCAMLVILLFFDWRLGLLSLIPVALSFLILRMMTGSRMKKQMREYQNALDTMSNEAVEFVRGISVVKTFGQSVYSFKRFKDSIDHYVTWVTAYTKQLRLPMMFYTTTVNAVFAILIAAGIVMTADGVTPEFLLNLIFYIIFTPIITITLTKIMFASENAMIVEDALNRIESITTYASMEEPKVPKHPIDVSVELSDVSFRYNGASHDALSHMSLTIKSGEHIALVGPSGGGKSTAARLIARFNDVSSGEILIGGVNVKDMSKEELMNTVAFVFQDSKLLKTSILENVRMGKPDASRDEVLKALSAAQCDDILEKLPHGVDTVIGSNGVYLSGGEQQRIAIARVMLKDARIVILDEATAFADPDNEYKVQAAFAELAKNKTMIMIAHRLSTVKDADRIFIVKNGCIEASGKHDELIKADSVYAEMWKQYLSSVQWNIKQEVQA